MNGTDFVDFAGKIAATYSDAASCRSAISRAYYGAFHLAKLFLDGSGIRPPRNANAHVFIQHRLANCGYSQAVEAGSFLADLYADRINADYNLHKTQVENIQYARTCVVTAIRIRDALEACDTDQVREQIKSGISDYERRMSGS